MTNKTLANGSPLTEDTFNDFIQRLQYQVRGKGVDDHCTCDAVFVVQRKELVSGIDKDYTDLTVLFDEDCRYFSKEEYLSELDEDTEQEWKLEGCPVDGTTYEFFEWMEEYKECTHTGYDWKYTYVNHHMTREGAEAFIKRKKHDYGKMRIYVDSAYWSWELKAIMNGLLDGEIVFNEKGGK